eukprot:gnl/TRDRNA2_/TRDRNA2_191083_c0_seq1.p1 gnl/TRDRNA2_/TRDRNA2_191083_c0~~gnl/TRDRNA2_/TRDRNA2_191083_c0_seq1.p1  ORF type:complete len:413 (+),score=104.90 gnl/TRDRNA2_/TRDRNA2_191083_c0_seq1:83-1321(+)
MAEAKGPLAGVRLLDLTTVVAGPMVGQILCDMGADVIKIETVAYPGDSYREAGSFKIKRSADGDKEAMGGCYYTVNRGKRCMALDMKKPDGKEIFMKLVKKADVLMINMRPAAATRLGIGYEQLKEINPELIYCASNGWGTSGPLAAAKAYDPVIQATAGVVASQARPAKQGGSDIHLVNNIVMDKTCAMTSVQAILAALYARTKGTGGQKIDLAMLDAGIAFNWSDCFADRTFGERKKDYRQGEGIVPEFFGTARTKDGKYVVVVSTEVALFAKAFDRPEMVKLLGKPVTIREAMTEEISKHDLEDVVARMKKWDMASIVIPLTEDQVLENPQVVHNKTVEVINDANFGKVYQARPPAVFSKTPLSIKGPAPLHGQHTAEILKELGYSEADVTRIKAGGVISTGGGLKSKM